MPFVTLVGCLVVSLDLAPPSPPITQVHASIVVARSGRAGASDRRAVAAALELLPRKPLKASLSTRSGSVRKYEITFSGLTRSRWLAMRRSM